MERKKKSTNDITFHYFWFPLFSKTTSGCVFVCTCSVKAADFSPLWSWGDAVVCQTRPLYLNNTGAVSIHPKLVHNESISSFQNTPPVEQNNRLVSAHETTRLYRQSWTLGNITMLNICEKNASQDLMWTPDIDVSCNLGDETILSYNWAEMDMSLLGSFHNFQTCVKSVPSTSKHTTFTECGTEKGRKLLY